MTQLNKMKLSRVDVSAYSNNAIRKTDGRFYMAHEVDAEIDALKARIERMEGQRKIEEAANDAAIEQIKRLKAENERLRMDAERVCKAAERLQDAVNKLWGAEYPEESIDSGPAMDPDEARQLHFEAWGALDTAIYHMRKGMSALPDTKGE